MVRSFCVDDSMAADDKAAQVKSTVMVLAVSSEIFRFVLRKATVE